MANEDDRRASAAQPAAQRTREDRANLQGAKSQAIRNAEHEAARLDRIYGPNR